MQEHTLIALAAPPTLAVIRGIRPEQLDAPTPCDDFDVQGLIAHMLRWGPALESAARIPPPAGRAPATDLPEQIGRLVTAWSEPAAWQGMTSMGGPQEMPAPMIGAMTIGEIVVHGWDLARATGQQVAWDPAMLEFLHDEVAKTAELGREMQAYGPEVTVSPSAPPLDRMLGLTGRDPSWRLSTSADTAR